MGPHSVWRLAAFVLGCLFPLAASPADSFQDPARETFRFGGTIKTLGFGSFSSLPDQSSAESALVTSLRLRVGGEPQRWFGYEVHLRLEDALFTVPLAVSQPGLTEGDAPLFRGLGEGHAFLDDDHHRLRGEVAYANIRLTYRNADLVVGRQALSFGRSFFWNPTDWLATFTPTEIDREYKTGVDAARLSLAVGRFSGIELLYAYGEHGDKDESAFFTRAFANFHGWDVEILAGSVWIDDRFGFAFSGDLGGAGLRGELSWHEPRSGNEPDFLRATLEADYRWPSSLVLIFEVHHNGWGSTEVGDYRQLFRSPRLTTHQLTNVGRHYVATQLSYELTPIAVASLSILGNLDDSSVLVNPTFGRTLSDESHLSVGAILPWGKAPVGDSPQSEFGTYATTLWLQWQWSF